MLSPDDSVVREIEDALRIAERSSDDFAVDLARATLGVALVHRPTPPERDRGQKLLAEVSDVFVRRGYLRAIDRSSTCIWRVRGPGVEIAMTPYRSCAPPSTICSARDSCCCGAFPRRVFWWRHCSIAGRPLTLPRPKAAIERLATAPADEGLVIREIWLLRLSALFPRAHGEDTAYRDCRGRYRDMARSLGFEGHIAWAEAMP